MNHPPTSVTESKLTCVGCGYNLTGVSIGSVCPECGRAVEDSIGARQADQTSSAAITCLVLGICSLAVMPLLGPLAIIYYYRAKREIETGFYSSGSWTMAKAGLILGVIATALIALVVLVLVAAG